MIDVVLLLFFFKEATHVGDSFTIGFTTIDFFSTCCIPPDIDAAVLLPVGTDKSNMEMLLVKERIFVGRRLNDDNKSFEEDEDVDDDDTAVLIAFGTGNVIWWL